MAEKAIYKRGEIRTVKFTAGASTDYVADEVILFIDDDKSSRVGVARQNIPRDTTGIVAVSGVFSFEKDSASDTYSAGMSVDITSDGTVKPASAEEANGIAQCCIVMADSADGDTHIDLDISESGIGDVTV